MIYLASPYSSDDQAVMEDRFEAACRTAAFMIRVGAVVFSPVAHSHPIAKHCGLSATDSDFWLRQDMRFLELCDEVVVLMIPGWDKSRGVAAEIATAERLGKPVSYCEPNEAGVRKWFQDRLIVPKRLRSRVS